MQIVIFYLLFSALFLIEGCKNYHGQASNPVQDEYFQSFHDRVERLYISAPDSAIILCEQVLPEMKKKRAGKELLYVYSFLGEIYQYRKVDDLKALVALHNAVHLFSEYPYLPFNNPYLIVDIGNILFRHGLFEQAVQTYKEAYNLKTDQENPYQKALICNNLALAWIESGNYEKAKFYFKKAAAHIPDKLDLMQAQNEAYHSKLFCLTGETDSIPVYCGKAASILEQFKSKSPALVNESSKERILYHNIRTQLDKSMAEYFLATCQYDSSLTALQSALRHSKIVQVKTLQSQLYFQMAKTFRLAGKHEQVPVYLDSALQLAQSLKNYQQALDYASALADYYADNNNTALTDSARRIAEVYSDSLWGQHVRSDIFNKKVALATAGMELTLGNIKRDQQRHFVTIHRQKVFIYFTVFLSFLLGFILLATYFQKKQEWSSRIPLVNWATRAAQKKIPPGSVPDRMFVNTGFDDLICRLNVLMDEEKPYLEYDLTLSKLADKLNTNQTYLSQLINQHYGAKFSDFINCKRVTEACNLLERVPANGLTIDHIYAQAGFRSKSTFYTAFRKFKGITPAAFIKKDTVEKNT